MPALIFLAKGREMGGSVTPQTRRLGMSRFSDRMRLRVAATRGNVRMSVRLASFIAGSTGLGLLSIIASTEPKIELTEMAKTVGDHMASALIVAAFMGLTYEWFLERTREAARQKEVAQAISSLGPMVPGIVFDMLADIALRSEHILLSFTRFDQSSRKHFSSETQMSSSAYLAPPPLATKNVACSQTGFRRAATFGLSFSLVTSSDSAV